MTEEKIEVGKKAPAKERPGKVDQAAAQFTPTIPDHSFISVIAFISTKCILK
jgi:hypothetical protein